MSISLFKSDDEVLTWIENSEIYFVPKSNSSDSLISDLENDLFTKLPRLIRSKRGYRALRSLWDSAVDKRGGDTAEGFKLWACYLLVCHKMGVDTEVAVRFMSDNPAVQCVVDELDIGNRGYAHYPYSLAVCSLVGN